jgi:hypothetical protein
MADAPSVGNIPRNFIHELVVRDARPVLAKIKEQPVVIVTENTRVVCGYCYAAGKVHARPLKMCGFRQHLSYFHGEKHRPIPVGIDVPESGVPSPIPAHGSHRNLPFGPLSDLTRLVSINAAMLRDILARLPDDYSGSPPSLNVLATACATGLPSPGLRLSGPGTLGFPSCAGPPNHPLVQRPDWMPFDGDTNLTVALPETVATVPLELPPVTPAAGSPSQTDRGSPSPSLEPAQPRPHIPPFDIPAAAPVTFSTARKENQPNSYTALPGNTPSITGKRKRPTKRTAKQGTATGVVSNISPPALRSKKSRATSSTR